MSLDENNNETEAQNQAEEPKQPETSSAADSAVAAKDAAGNIVANLLALKESNPKVFFWRRGRCGAGLGRLDFWWWLRCQIACSPSQSHGSRSELRVEKPQHL